MRVEVLTEFAPGTEQLLYPYAAEEFLRAGALQQQILAQSEAARVIYLDDKLLCYAGIVRPLMTEPPLLWLLLAKGFTRWSSRTVRQLSSMLATIHPGTRTVIDCSHTAGHRFAKFCGFKPLDQFVEIADRRFQYYEVI